MAYITQLKQQKLKGGEVVLLKSTLTLRRCATKVITPFLLFLLCDVCHVAITNCFKLEVFFTFIAFKVTLTFQ